MRLPAGNGPAEDDPIHDDPFDDDPFDLVGVGLGPFNLSLAALADGLPALRTRFFETSTEFSWHPGLLLDGTRIQVPFLADLVTLVDPTNRWSFLSYLHEHQRLFRFYFYERFHIPRREYDHYCRWVAANLGSTRFGSKVQAVRWEGDTGLFHIDLAAAERAATVTARNIVLGVGTEPSIPAELAPMIGPDVFHSAEYRMRRRTLAGAEHVTVVGSGQSGAEVFADLLRDQPASGHRLHWITRTPAFSPMEYSKLGLEQFTPDHVRYFHSLDQATKDMVVPTQWQLYKAIDADTIAEIYDLLYERTIGGASVDATLLPHVAIESAARSANGRISVACRHIPRDHAFMVETDRLVLATGYSPRRPVLLDPMSELLDLDDHGRFKVDETYRVATAPAVTGRIYVQNAELHTHGIGAPDLGLGAWRAAVILDDLTHGGAYRVPEGSAFTTFGADPQTRAPGSGRRSPMADSAVDPPRGTVPAPTAGGGRWVDDGGP